MKINLDGNEWYIILEWLLQINYDLEGILNWIIIEEIIVINPIKIIEKSTPKKSAVIPEIIAPMA